MTMHAAAGPVDRPTSTLDWSMVRVNGDRAHRRAAVSLSSTSALASSAARRRLHGLPLDDRELAALQVMHDELLDTAHRLRSGEPSVPSPEQTFAFSRLAFDALPVASRPKNRHDDGEIASVFEGLAKDLKAVHDGDRTASADRVADAFEAFSRVLLREVSQQGETFGRPAAV